MTEDVQSALKAERTKIDGIEWDTVERFNVHMDEVLDHFAYVDLNRVWLERPRRTTGGDGRP